MGGNEIIKVYTISFTESLYWIGGYNFNTDEAYEWSSKPTEAMPYTNWGKKEPKWPQENLCVTASFAMDWQWKTASCSDQVPFICEIEL